MNNVHAIALVKRSAASAVIIHQMLRDFNVQPDERHLIHAFNGFPNSEMQDDLHECPINLRSGKIDFHYPVPRVPGDRDMVHGSHVPCLLSNIFLRAAQVLNSEAAFAGSTEPMYLYAGIRSDSGDNEQTNKFAYSMQELLYSVFDRRVLIITPLLYANDAMLKIHAEGLGSECQELVAKWSQSGNQGISG